ncbi:MAG TPA: SH3 domain-containing protein, partial [Aggregatilineales bacterium]|nr:SH3 domain-containing protein [Aggregatilineales bacterium]
MKRFILALLISLFGMNVLHAQGQSSGDCIAAPPNQLEIGSQAIIQENLGSPVNLRVVPSTLATKIGELEAGDQVNVIAGPVCGRGNNLYSWWQIELGSGLTGWVAEGDSFLQRAIYFIAPAGQSNVAAGDSNATAEICDAAPPSQVDIGSVAEVNPVVRTVRLRNAPSGDVLQELNTGVQMEIIAGPRCGDNDRGL